MIEYTVWNHAAKGAIEMELTEGTDNGAVIRVVVHKDVHGETQVTITDSSNNKSEYTLGEEDEGEEDDCDGEDAPGSIKAYPKLL